MRDVNPINEVFEPILGRPSWSVERGRESATFPDRSAMVFIEFGDPVLTVSQPRDWPIHIDGAPETTPGRLTNLRGEWHLTLTECAWNLKLNATQLATGASPGDLVDRALDVLNGQALTEIDVRPRDGATTFVFDLGCVLHTSPRTDICSSDPSEQWVLITASRAYLRVRSDGRYQIRPVAEPDAEHPWIEMA